MYTILSHDTVSDGVAHATTVDEARYKYCSFV